MKESKGDEPNKSGRGSQKQTKVLIMIESKDNSNKHRPSKRVKYLKMKVIENLRADTINEKLETHLASDTNVITDSYSSYKKITPKVNHTSQIVNKANVDKVLPWVHKAISNAKRLSLAIHHRVDDDFLQNYLNEFCYKFNRRYFGEKTMERLIIAGVNHRWNEL